MKLETELTKLGYLPFNGPKGCFYKRINNDLRMEISIRDEEYGYVLIKYDTLVCLENRCETPAQFLKFLKDFKAPEKKTFEIKFKAEDYYPDLENPDFACEALNRVDLKDISITEIK